MPALIWQRDVGQDMANARNTFSSWDSCMSEAYCKWPAIIGIVIGSIILISVIWCCARCLCCGAECCCACCSCFNRCCPSPRRNNQGYQQPPAQPYQQYQSHPQPMMYGGAGAAYGGYRGPQTATFDAPSKQQAYNEDALPAMPSWNEAQTKRVQDEDVEMEKLDHNSAQQESLLNRNDAGAVGGRYYNNQNQATQEHGDLGALHASPYREHDYDAHQQFVGSPVSSVAHSMYPPTYQTRPQSSVYDSGYAPSIPPSYHTAAPTVVSPVQQTMPMPGNYARRPVQGSWRDV